MTARAGQPKRRGSGGNNRILLPDAEIAIRYRHGATIKKLAELYSVSQATIILRLSEQGVPSRYALIDAAIGREPARVWCTQQDRRIRRTEAQQCRSPFCKGQCI